MKPQLASQLSNVPDQAPDDADLSPIDPEMVDNTILRAALERVRERTKADPHMGHYTKHSSHSSHSKGGW
jgi:hypothetical protein